MRKDTFTVGTGKVLKFKPVNKELLKNNYYFKKKDKPETNWDNFNWFNLFWH